MHISDKKMDTVFVAAAAFRSPKNIRHEFLATLSSTIPETQREREREREKKDEIMPTEDFSLSTIDGVASITPIHTVEETKRHGVTERQTC